MNATASTAGTGSRKVHCQAHSAGCCACPGSEPLLQPERASRMAERLNSQAGVPRRNNGRKRVCCPEDGGHEDISRRRHQPLAAGGTCELSALLALVTTALAACVVRAPRAHTQRMHARRQGGFVHCHGCAFSPACADSDIRTLVTC